MAEKAQQRRIEHLEQKVHSLHRTVLDKNVLKGLLPIRAQAAARRSATQEARSREQQFAARSHEYAREIASEDTLAHCTRVITLDSLTWWVPLLRPDDPTAVERALRHQDFPYRAITQTREVGIGGVMLDIGANSGRMAIPRVILGDVTAVYCAEPDLQNYQCLTRNVRDNELRGLVLPDRVAIASRDGVVSLEQGKTTGGHRVLPQHMEGTRPTSAVEGLTLDSWIDRLGIDPDEVAFVKVDVQGSETHVLGGARRLLQCRHVAWQIEVDLRALRDRGLKDDDLLGPMRDSFTHFVDLSRSVAGERVRSTRDLDEGLKYLSDGSDSRTDVLLFSLGV